MRKSIILIIALAIFGVLLGEGVGWAEKINLSGRHPAGEVFATCEAVGGSFFSNGTYGCSKPCAGGDTCAVECRNGKCTGSCPACGRRGNPSPLPRLGGADAVTGILKNSVRPARRY